MNWTVLNTPTAFRQEAERVLKKEKKRRKGVKTRLIKVSSTPITYKEVEVDS